jgi:C4-dicarboxylate-specific signal transduction histidine kinase
MGGRKGAKDVGLRGTGFMSDERADSTLLFRHTAEDRWPEERTPPHVAHNLERITEVLVSVANGRFDVRAPRSYSGDPWDVLAFLANETSEEVKRLLDQVHQERSELQEAQERLYHSEKLAALGELAGGVAHELNQPLTVMQTLAELLLEKPNKTVEERRREIELILAATKRMGRIVSAVRTFGRQAPFNFGVLDLKDPIAEALSLLQESLHAASIHVELIFPEVIPKIRGDGEALQQVFINLLSNAKDILEDTPLEAQRRVVISLEEAEGRLLFRVCDNGPGVPESAVDKIFDPFFSTKSVGRGTGLGLSISHRIVAEHGGTLLYTQGPLGGACFLIEFPSLTETD